MNDLTAEKEVLKETVANLHEHVDSLKQQMSELKTQNKRVQEKMDEVRCKYCTIIINILYVNSSL